MSGKKITELNELGSASNDDLFVVVDDPSGSAETKKITKSNLFSGVATGDMETTTYDPANVAEQLTGLTATQTLTNKTLTTPVIPSIYQDAGKTKLMTLPDTASDTIVTLAATQTLTNKTVGGVTDTNLVDKSASETISGEWTYSTFPITPSAAPDADYEVANKKYVDDNSGGFVGLRVRAYLGTNESTVAGVREKIIFDTESYDPGSDYDNTTGVYTAPDTGVYLINTNIRFAVTTDQDELVVIVEKGGTTDIARSIVGASSTEPQTVAVTTVLYLTSGTAIQIDANNASSNDTVEAGEANTYLEIQRIA